MGGRVSYGSTAGGIRYGWAQTTRYLPPPGSSSPVEDLAPKFHCNLDCKWATNKPSCVRSRKSLEAYFKKHGKFNIVHREYAGEYPECPLFEQQSKSNCLKGM